MKTIRMMLSREQIVEALGHYVCEKHDMSSGTGAAQVLFIYDLSKGPADVQIIQARVEIEFKDESA